MKIEEVSSNVAITEQNEKQYVRIVAQVGIRGTQKSIFR